MLNKKLTLLIVCFFLFTGPFVASLSIYDSYQVNQNSSSTTNIKIDDIDVEVFQGDDYLVYHLTKDNNNYNTCNIISNLFIKRVGFENELYLLVNKDESNEDYIELKCDDYYYNNTFYFSDLKKVPKELKSEIDDLILQYNKEYSSYLNNPSYYILPSEYVSLFITNEDFFENHYVKLKVINSITSRSFNNYNYKEDSVVCDWGDDTISNPRCLYFFPSYASFERGDSKNKNNYQYDAIAAGGTYVHTLVPGKTLDDDFYAKIALNFLVFGKNSADYTRPKNGYSIKEFYIYWGSNNKIQGVFGETYYSKDSYELDLNKYKEDSRTIHINFAADFIQDGKRYNYGSDKLGFYSQSIKIECSSDQHCIKLGSGTKCISDIKLNTPYTKCDCVDTSRSDACLSYSNGHSCDGDLECASELCVKKYSNEDYKICKSCAGIGNSVSNPEDCCEGLHYDDDTNTCVYCNYDSDCGSKEIENICKNNDVYTYDIIPKCKDHFCEFDYSPESFFKECDWIGTNGCYNGKCVCMDKIGCDVCLDLPKGNMCDCDSECSSGLCSNNKCVNDPVCGDGVCHDDEECVEDCVEIGVFHIDDDSYDQGEKIKFHFFLKNVGDVSQSFTLTMGVVPESWEGRFIDTSLSGSLSCNDEQSFFEKKDVYLSVDDKKFYSPEFNVPNRNLRYDDYRILEDNMLSFVELGDCDSNERQYKAIETNINQCNYNNICEYGEDSSNCRSDCPCNYNNICEEKYENIRNCRNDCPCNENGKCEFSLGETFENCKNDCFCNNDLSCQENHGENEETCPKDCKPCDFLDGSNYLCDCDVDSDCPSGFFCNQVSGPDGCEVIVYEDECMQHNDYYCKKGNVYYCEYNGNFYEEIHKEDCNNDRDKFCNEANVAGLGACDIDYSKLDTWIDYSSPETKINKQVGDKFILNIQNDYPRDVKLSYNSVVYSSSCKNGKIYVDGLLKCEFSVKSQSNNSTIKVGNKKLFLEIINYPNNIYLTNSKKLFERFQNEPDATKALLRELYLEAEKNYGVVYDLSLYNLERHPFNNYFDYKEDFTNFYMDNNSHAQAVSNFVKEKLNGASNVIVVGDDYVVPHYRREISEIERNWIFSDKEFVNEIYTDVHLINFEGFTFDQYYKIFFKEGKYEMKDTLLILPDNITPELRESIDALKETFNQTKYRPNITEVKSSDVHCIDKDWIKETRDTSLIIIGTEKTNDIYKCFPFVKGEENEEAAILLPSVWNPYEYALVLNTNDPLNVDSFSAAIKYSDDNSGFIDIKSNKAYLTHKRIQKVQEFYLYFMAVGVILNPVAFLPAAVTKILKAGAVFTIFQYADTPIDIISSIDSCHIHGDSQTFSCFFDRMSIFLPYSLDFIKNIKRVSSFSETYEQLTKKIVSEYSDDVLAKMVSDSLRFKTIEKDFVKYFNYDLSSVNIPNKMISNKNLYYINRGLDSYDFKNFDDIVTQLDSRINLRNIDDITRKKIQLSLLYRQGVENEFKNAVSNIPIKVKDDSFTKKLKKTYNPKQLEDMGIILNDVDESILISSLIKTDSDAGELLLKEFGEERLKRLNFHFDEDFLIDPDYSSKQVIKYNGIDSTEYAILRNDATDGVIVVNKNTDEIISIMNENKFESVIRSINNNGGANVNIYKETKMKEFISNQYGLDLVNTNNLKAELIDLSYIDPVDGRIKKVIANTGGLHSAEQIATKLQKTRNIGFKFGNSDVNSVIEFYYDDLSDFFDFEDFLRPVSDPKYLELEGIIKVDKVKNTITFLEDGNEVTIKFMKKELI